MNITIVGGGIGGLATAKALLNQGFSVHVCERAHVLRPIGAGLTLTPNGLNSLEAIQPGIVELLTQAGSPLHTLTLKRSTGETIASKPINLIQQYGQPMLNIRWSKLQAILASTLPPEIVEIDRRCVGFEQDRDGVTTSFADGTTVESDLLIGADGIDSIVRQGLIGDGMPNYAGRMSWRAVIKYPHDRLAANASTLIASPDGKNFLLVDLGQGYTFWSASTLSATEFSRQAPPNPRLRVLEAFANWAEPVTEIIAATPEADIVERPIHDRPPLPHWSQGRVTLLGDAAHPVVPSLGQGANMAFEDAYELAACLAIAPKIETALNMYENSRIPRTTEIYDRSAEQGRLAYQPDSETIFGEMMKPSQMSQDDFEAWLYRYQPI
jgi:salicylate hydroxylase